MIKKALASVVATVAMAQVAVAQDIIIPNPKPVPEISALEGIAAVAALAAVVLLVWERRRRTS